MTVNVAGYISIDGKYYKVLAPEYKRGFEPAKVVRRSVLGNTIVSIGPGNADRNTSAVLYIAFSLPATGYAKLTDLQTAAEKATVSYTDHVTGGSEWDQALTTSLFSRQRSYSSRMRRGLIIHTRSMSSGLRCCNARHIFMGKQSTD